VTELDRDEFTAGYLIEADEHVRSAIANLLTLEQALRSGSPQHRHIRELFRSLHTLKGLSAMVGVDPIVDIAHEMETILRDAERGSTKLTVEAVEVLLEGIRAIELRTSAFAQKQAIPVAPTHLLEALAALQTSQGSARTLATSAGADKDSLVLDAQLLAKLSPPELEQLMASIAAGKHAWRIDFHPSPERSAAGFTISTVRERLSEIGEIVKVLPLSVPRDANAPGGLVFALLVLSEAPPAQLASASGTDASKLTPIALSRAAVSSDASERGSYESDPDDLVQGNRGVIRVELSRLDDALDKLAALVVTRFKLANCVNELRDRGVDVRELTTIAGEVHRQLRDLRRAITRSRMVSVGELLERVPLIVRAMSRSTGKQVRLSVDAGKAELDKAVAERVFPAIVHLVRNAVDHAIETPEERVRLGKAPEGTITVTCFEHSDAQLELRISDDGRGIDAAAISRRAGREVPTDERGILELITMPGLSTLDVATSTSGRGMGMDIVRRIAVDMLGGDLTLQTTPGRGTTFTMRLPLSISILDSFSFVCGTQAFAVPVAIVDEIIDLTLEHVVVPPAPVARARAGHTRQLAARLLKRRGEVIPLFELASLLQLEAADPARCKAFIVRSHGQPFAFSIDRVLGQQEIVVRPIEDPLVRVRGVAGTTDLGDGRPTLVLDLVGLSSVASAGAMA